MKKLILLLAIGLCTAVLAQVVTIAVKFRGNAPITVGADIGGMAFEASFQAPLKVTGQNKVGHASYEWQVEQTGDAEWTVMLMRDGVHVPIMLSDWAE